MLDLNFTRSKMDMKLVDHIDFDRFSWGVPNKVDERVSLKSDFCWGLAQIL